MWGNVSEMKLVSRMVCILKDISKLLSIEFIRMYTATSSVQGRSFFYTLRNRVLPTY